MLQCEEKVGWKIQLMVVHLLKMYKALSLISSTASSKQNKTKNKTKEHL